MFKHASIRELTRMSRPRGRRPYGEAKARMSSNVTGALMQGRDSIGFARTGPSICRICATTFRSQAGSPHATFRRLSERSGASRHWSEHGPCISERNRSPLLPTARQKRNRPAPGHCKRSMANRSHDGRVISDEACGVSRLYRPLPESVEPRPTCHSGNGPASWSSNA